MDFMTLLIVLIGIFISFRGLVYILLGKYENRWREIIFWGASAIFVGATYILLGGVVILVALVGDNPLEDMIGMYVYLVGAILSERIGEVIYEGQDKSTDTVPKFKQKSKRKLKNEEKLKRSEKPKNGPLPY